MDFRLRRPDMVDESAKTGGKNLFLEILMFLGVMIVYQLITAVIVVPISLCFLALEYVPSTNVVMLLNLASTALGILTAIFFCKWIQKRKPWTLGYKKPGMVKEYLIGLAAGFLCMAFPVLVCILTGAATLSFNPMAATFSGVGALIALFLGFCVQGMSEEVLCRGYLMISMARKKGRIWIAIVLSALAFAALHLLNAGITVLAFINLTLFGIFAGFYFVKRGNIWGIAAFHTMWNFTQGNVFGILVSGNNFGTSIFLTHVDPRLALLNGGDFGIEGGLLTTLVLAVGLIVLAFTKQKDWVETPVPAAEAAANIL